MKKVLRWIFVPLVMLAIPLQFTFILLIISVLTRSSELMVLAYAISLLVAAAGSVFAALSIAPLRSTMVTVTIFCGIPIVWVILPSIVKWLGRLDTIVDILFMSCALIGGAVAAYLFERQARYA